MIEQAILSGLVTSDKYTRKVIPFLQQEYFSEQSDKTLFTMIRSHIEEYNSCPSKDVLKIQLDDIKGINEQTAKEITQKIEGFNESFDYENEDWLMAKTEQFCKDKAVFNAVKQSILILDDAEGKVDRGAIPQILSDALAVSFDSAVGHDFLDDFSARYDFYHTRENKIEFDIEILNKTTKGGISRKALSCILAPTGVGKSLAMCHFAAANLMMGYNVLYVTLEMAEERIAERIDANLLDLTIDELHEIPREVYNSRISSVMKQTTGKLIIKEYPTSSANVNHFRFLLNELKLKKKFVPDVIFVDYLNICSSSRVKMAANVNSYSYVKNIAEEMRGLAVEFNVAIITATQTNREGLTSSDIDLTNVSESTGLSSTVDHMVALISTEELEASKMIMMKQLKNRWGDINTPKRFVVGIERGKMRLTNIDDPEKGLVDDKPTMDSTNFGERDAENGSKIKFGFKKNQKQAFSGAFS